MIKHIEDRVLRLSALVSRWKQHGNIPRIERDLALDELREIYDALLNVDDGRVAPESLPAPQQVSEQPAHPEPKPASKSKPEPQPIVERVAEPEPQMEHTADPVADFDDALDIDAILGIGDEKPQGEPEPKNETNNGGGLFAVEDIPVRKKSSRKMISLYNTSSATAPKPESQAAYQPAAVPAYSAPAPHQPLQQTPQPVETAADAPAPQRLGDVLGSGVKVVGDVTTLDNKPIAPMNKITDLRKAIGVNDKFLLLRDLFAGDVALYERTIDALNRFEDLDECMIFIVENFSWNPDSEGAKMLVELIERKLS